MTTTALYALALLSGCCDPDFDHTPLDREDWPTSTPRTEGLDPDLVDKLYCKAQKKRDLHAVLVVKNGLLVAEGYFNGRGVDEPENIASATKSYTSALVGLALDQGCLDDLDAPMLDWFPEVVDRIDDPRKHDVTIRHLLKMRGGYVHDEQEYRHVLFSQEYVDAIIELPLFADPGAYFEYSNLSSHWLGVIVARACGTDLRSFAEEHLLEPLDTKAGAWTQDKDGYYYGMGNFEVSARELARFGQLYLDDGVRDGEQLLSVDWIEDSLAPYSVDVRNQHPERYLKGRDYGYQWWGSEAGGYEVDFAAGHGGQYAFLVRELDLMVVVVGEDHFLETGEPTWGGRAWTSEKAHYNLGGWFIDQL